MTTAIKPIETRYNGYRFRSRLEARWAVFFDELEIEYIYEKEGFDLGKAGYYLPDFWLPQVFMWAEVKPKPLNDTELEKVKALVQGTGYDCLILVGEEVSNHPYWGISTEQLKPDYTIDHELTDEDCKRLIESQRGVLPFDGNYEWEWFCLTNYHNYPTNEHRFYASPGCIWSGASHDEIYGDNDTCWDDTTEAMIAARSARFEFGE